MSTQLTPDLREALEAFLASPLDRKWIHTPQLSIYVRKSLRCPRNQPLKMLDVGDIEVAGHLRRQGLFRQLLGLMHTLCGEQYGGVLVENVLNPDLRRYLEAMAETDPTHCVWDAGLLRFYWLAGGA